MAAKDKILQAVRAAKLPPRDLPDLAGPWIRYDDRRAQFADMLRSVGGRCESIARLDEVPARLAEHPAFPAARKIASCVPEALAGNVDWSALPDPHQLEDIDFAVARGQFAVAENGAIWVAHGDAPHRALYFIVQHLVLLVPASQLVDNMHQAYLRLAFDRPGFGVFISGPSKTADIEQSLVIGAHGPRSLTVLLHDEAADSAS